MCASRYIYDQNISTRQSVNTNGNVIDIWHWLRRSTNFSGTLSAGSYIRFGSVLLRWVTHRLIYLLRICYDELYYSDVIMGAMASQITSLTIVYSTVCSGADQRKTSKLRVTGLCEGNSSVTGEFPHKGPVTRKMFSFDDVIMESTLEQTTSIVTLGNITVVIVQRAHIWWMDFRVRYWTILHCHSDASRRPNTRCFVDLSIIC